MQMTVSELEPGLKKVDLQGRMDVSGTQEIDISFSVLTLSEPTNIIVDLSGVDYITSIGIGLLVRSANDLKQQGRSFVLLKPKPIVFRVLEATKINSIIPIVFDLESAYASLKNPNIKL